MEWWDTFVEGIKTFWNQPIPIIGFTVGALIVGILSIMAKTSIGKKALNEIKRINEGLKTKLLKAEGDLRESQDKLKALSNEVKSRMEELEEWYGKYLEDKDAEIAELKKQYESMLSECQAKIDRQAEMIKALCEASVNKIVKEAYKAYCEVQEHGEGKEAEDH